MDQAAERIKLALATGETLLWSGRGTLLRTAWWRRWDLVLGALLLSLATDVPPLVGTFNAVFDTAAEHVLGVPPLAVGAPDPFASSIGGLVNLALAMTGLWYLFRFLRVVEDHGHVHHAVTDRRILLARRRSVVSVPLGSIASFYSDACEWGGGVELRQVGSRRRLVMAGLEDADAATSALASAIGRTASGAARDAEPRPTAK